jgi:hypothetical protein
LLSGDQVRITACRSPLGRRGAHHARSVGPRPLSTQTPKIPEYWRELPVKAPWRSTGAAAGCRFLDCRSPLDGRRSGSRARTTESGGLDVGDPNQSIYCFAGASPGLAERSDLIPTLRRFWNSQFPSADGRSALLGKMIVYCYEHVLTIQGYLVSEDPTAAFGIQSP